MNGCLRIDIAKGKACIILVDFVGGPFATENLVKDSGRGVIVLSCCCCCMAASWALLTSSLEDVMVRRVKGILDCVNIGIVLNQRQSQRGVYYKQEVSSSNYWQSRHTLPISDEKMLSI